MSDRKLVVLGCTAVLMVILAVVVGGPEKEPEFAFTRGSYLVPDLDVDRIAAITIEKDGRKVVLEKRAGLFLVASKLSYPASSRTINRLIRTCLDIRCAQEVTRNPANHVALGVSGDAGSRVVRFLDGDGKELVHIILSPEDPKTGAVYVRPAASEAVYASEEPVLLYTDDMSYVDRTILQIKPEDIREVAVITPEGTYHIGGSGGTVTLKEVPAGKRARETDVKWVMNATTNLSFSDLRSEADVKDIAFDYTYTVLLKRWDAYQCQMGREDGKTFARCRARFTGPEKMAIRKDQSDEELKQVEAMLQAREAVENFNLRHQSWLYEIPPAKAEEMTKPLSALIETTPSASPSK